MREAAPALSSAAAPTPSDSTVPLRRADFATLAEALDYAAQSACGLNFHSGRGEPVEVLPYRDLRAQARSLARRMVSAGFRRGERIALVAETDGDFVRGFFACAYAGLVPVPLPLPMAFGGRDAYVAHIRGMLSAARASGALAPAALTGWVEQASEGLGLRAIGHLRLFEAFPEDRGELPAAEPGDVAYLQFSSGSTRFPLGVAVTHRSLTANARAIAEHGLRIVQGDRGVSWLPFYHDMGLVGFLLTPLATQLSVDCLPTREFARRPLTWLTLIARNGGTLSFSPSFGYELCARRAAGMDPDGIDLSRWRAAGIGGDMIRPHVLARFAGRFAGCGFDRRAFVPSYGLAEATLAVAFAPPGTGATVDRVDMDRLEREGCAAPPAGPRRRTRDFVLCGPPLPGHAVEIRDEAGTALGERRVGRVFVRGPSLMRAYFDRPEDTARVLSPDGWLDTGDLGYRIGGSLVITGRVKDLIIVNGRNIWPQDLEWSAERVGGLRSGDAAAFSVDDGGSSESVFLLVHCRAADPPARRALRDAIAGLLRVEHGVEAAVVLVPPHSLPQTSSGKLSRSRARHLFLTGELGEEP